MITIRSDLPFKPQETEHKRLYNNISEAISLIHNHLLPLKESSNTPDNILYRKAYSSLSEIASSHNLEGIFNPLPREISNWNFLQTLAFCWRDYGVINSVGRDVNSKDLGARYALEDVGIRVLAKYDVVNTCLFKQQTHYSIFGWDIGLLNMSLRDILMQQKRIPVNKSEIK